MEPNPLQNKNKNKKKIKNKSKKDLKSLPEDIQIKLQNNALITEYNYNTSIDEAWLPVTEIIEYLKNEYLPFSEELNEIRKNGDEFFLNDLFLIPEELTIPQTKFSIKINLKQNPNMPFNKFISINEWLLNNNNKIYKNKNTTLLEIASSIKPQIGKDIFRTALVEINNEIFYSVNHPSSDEINKLIDSSNQNYYKNTDFFNKKIMDVMKQEGILIDFNTLNIIDILSAQNIANLLQMTIHLFLNQKVKPEFVFDYKFNRDIKIVLKKDEQYILQDFKSLLIISNEGEIPTNPCGFYSGTLKVDLKNKIFSLENFTVYYDFTNNSSEEPNNSNNLQPTVNNPDNSSQLSSINNYKNKAYNFLNNNKATIAAGVAASGVASVGALYLAGILGGKSHNFTSKRKKRIKNKKSNKFTNIRIKKIKTKKHFYNDVNKKNKSKRNK
jgi:hypothetical protein